MGSFKCLLSRLTALVDRSHRENYPENICVVITCTSAATPANCGLPTVGQLSRSVSSPEAADLQANQDSDVVIAALALTCTHGNPDQGVLATLLCTSKELQTAIMQSYACTACISACLTPRTSYICLVKSFHRWLRRHGSMLRSLTISLPQERGSWPNTSASSDVVEDALQKLTARTTLQLQSFIAEDWPSSTPRILQQLPCSTLTRLRMVATEPVLVCHLASLTRLSNLRSLDFMVLDSINVRHIRYIMGTMPLVEGYKWTGPEPGPDLSRASHRWVTLPEAFAALGQLTYLHLYGLNQISAVADYCPYLPETLQELQLPWDYQLPPQPLNIGHLTALTGFLYGYTLQEADVLPSSLIKVTVDDATSLEPLLPLKQLRLLTVTSCNLTARQLQDIASKLTTLQSVQLVHKSPASIAGAAAGWSCLPIDNITLWVPCGEKYHNLATTSLQQLGKLPFLKHLTFAGVDLGNSSLWQRDAVSGTRRQLAAFQSQGSVGQLPTCVLKLSPDLVSTYSFARLINTVLKRASATGTGEIAAAGTDGKEAMTASEAASIALQAVPPPVLLAGSAATAAGAKLTGLSLVQCNLSDSSAVALLQSCKQMVGLQQLDLSDNKDITDSLLRFIPKELPGLTSLNVRHCDVSKQGVADLMAEMTKLSIISSLH